MSDPVLITLIVCIAVVVVMLIALGISLLEKLNDKKEDPK